MLRRNSVLARAFRNQAMAQKIDKRSLLAAGLLLIGASTLAAAQDASPFPPGKNAALVKKVCTECHAPGVVISTKFDEDLAKRQYKRFVGDPDSEEGKKVIEYLTTVLGAN